MELNRNVCIFTGTGFSNAIFGQKIQNDFINDFLDSDESKIFIECLPKDLKSMLNKINDIELVMSHYHNLAYSDLKRHINNWRQYKRDIVFLRSAISVYFREKLNSIKDIYQIIDRKTINNFFIRNKITKNNAFIVTTNYDMGFEKIINDIFKNDIFNNDNYYYPGRFFTNNKDTKNKVPILKLHGSINWMEERGLASDIMFKRPECNLKIYSNLLDELKLTPFNDSDETTSGFSLNHSNGKKYTPIIIPFFYQKQEWLKQNKGWEKLFSVTWAKAHELMSKSNKFFFLGYGLPNADHYIYTFLYSILRNKTVLCHAVDIKPDSKLLKLLDYLYLKNNINYKSYKSGIKNYFNEN